MSDVAIQIDVSSGEVTALIPSRVRGKDVQRPYHIDKAPAGLDVRAWWVTAKDTGRAYHVGIDRRSVLRCGCEHARFRGQRRSCKHVAAVRALLLMLESLK